MKRLLAASAALCLALGAAQTCFADMPTGSALFATGTTIYLEDFEGPYNIVMNPALVTAPGPVVLAEPVSVPAAKLENITDIRGRYLTDLFAK